MQDATPRSRREHMSPQRASHHHRGAMAEVPHIIADTREQPNETPNGAALWVVAKGNIPDELMPGLRRDFTEAELARIYSRIHKTLAPANAKPMALFIFGPLLCVAAPMIAKQAGWKPPAAAERVTAAVRKGEFSRLVRLALRHEDGAEDASPAWCRRCFLSCP